MLKIEEWVMELCFQKCLPELLYPAWILSYPAKMLPCYTLLPYQNTTEACDATQWQWRVKVNLWNSQIYSKWSQPWLIFSALFLTQFLRFVPTMGNLHEGHLELIDAALQRGDEVLLQGVFPVEKSYHVKYDYAYTYIYMYWLSWPLPSSHHLGFYIFSTGSL